MDQIPSTLPVLPIRNAVLFPSVSMPLVIGREKSIKAIEFAQKSEQLICVVAQRAMTSGDPGPGDLHRVGTLCRIETVVPSENGGRQTVVTGIIRFKIGEFVADEAGFLSCRGELVADLHGEDPVRSEALFFNLKEMAREILELLPGTTEPLARLVERVDDSSYLSNVCAAYLNLTLSQKQELLETVEVNRRIETLLAYMQKEREVLNLQREIREKMSERLSKAQREALLREQMRTIRTELGEETEDENSQEIEDKIEDANLPEEAAKQAKEELRRLKALPPASAEYHVIRTYLEWIAALPWARKSFSEIDVAHAKAILDEEHYGLAQVKQRILQFLAVAKLKNDLHGPILCLVGPPGTGKTSLGQSIARALGRKFIRASLGGVRDEAEIRGHRRTYVGAMPGRIIQSLRRASTRNPVMMLDEIDKLRADFHGDPSAAMLEVLDPEQNTSFTDHYLDVPFDLSDVFFIATANVTDPIPGPLRDRMEIIEVSGYTSLEKVHIARNHLYPKSLKEHGLDAAKVSLPDPVLDHLIHAYTREAGVRELSRKIAALMRAAVEEIVVNGAEKVEFTNEKLRKILGIERFYPELAEKNLKPGVAVGLAWTPMGGDILFIEAAATISGKGQLLLTGQLGDVMKESAQIALTLARSLLPPSFDFSKHDLHIHLPAGGIPKDGPSAGVTLLSALSSLITKKPLPADLAMTGEITLRGSVLPVGGIKEKLLAAQRAGLKRIILPKRNEPDLAEVPEEVRDQLTFIFVETVEQVLDAALGFHPSVYSLPISGSPSEQPAA